MRRACILGLLWLAVAAGRAAAEPITIDQDDLRRRAFIAEPELRIEIVEAAREPRLQMAAGTTLTFGDGRRATLPSGGWVRCAMRNARPPVRQYAVGVRTFLHAKLHEARQVFDEWQAKGYSVRLLEAGRVFRTESGAVLADTRVYWVVLGHFATEAEAQQLERTLQKQGSGTWIVMETLRLAGGEIELRADGGAVLAAGPVPVHVESPQPVQVADVQFGVGFWGRGYREYREYPGSLELDATVDGMVTLFNTVPMSEYIAGVVPAEISVKAPMEAMKAQAVAARTEALAKLDIKHFGEPFHFCSTQHCQAYAGLTRRTPRSDEAVRDTLGIALLSNGTFVDTVYSANCGGHTEHNNLVWSSNADPALRGKLDAPDGAVPFGSPLSEGVLKRWLTTRPQTYCGDPRVNADDKFRWRVRMTPAELTRHVNQHYRVGNVRDIQLGERGVSGRLRSVRIIGDRDRVTVRKELNIRRVFGGMKSAMFIVEITRDASGVPTSFEFIGGGWGHGVGLCQNGAMGMALDGYTFPGILKHYFTGAYLQRVYG